MPDREPRRPGLTKDGALVSDLLKLLLKIRSKEAGVAAKLIARSDELEALAAGRAQGPRRSCRGWRFEEFGRDALDLVEGRLGFAIENGKLKMSRLARGDSRCVSCLVPIALAGCAAAPPSRTIAGGTCDDGPGQLRRPAASRNRPEILRDRRRTSLGRPT